MHPSWKVIIWDKGGTCPHCDRWGKVYPRDINYTMAAGLIWLSRMTADGEYIDVPRHGPKWMTKSNQHPTLKWWGLVERPDPEPMPGEELGPKKFSGLWRTTSLGNQWAKGEVAVHKRVFTYNDMVVGHEGPMVLPSDCVENFDYREVMQPNYRPIRPPRR